MGGGVENEELFSESLTIMQPIPEFLLFKPPHNEKLREFQSLVEVLWERNRTFNRLFGYGKHSGVVMAMWSTSLECRHLYH